MIRGLLGKKIGMTQIFTGEGARVPVTVIETGPCTIQAVKTLEKDGYSAVQLGFWDTKPERLKKPQREYNKARKLPAKKFVREVQCDPADDLKIGSVITNSMFQAGDYVDVVGVSKGKGFQGGVKRHGWAGGADTHGSMSHRAPGSIGQSSFPSRVFKGLGMAGHMGSDRCTMQNLKVVDVDTENNTIAVEGSVPGANNTYVVIKYALKKAVAPRVEPKGEEEKENSEEGSKE